MALYLGSGKQKIRANGLLSHINLPPKTYKNLADSTSEDWLVDTRLASGYGYGKPSPGCIFTNFIPAKMGDILRVKGLALTTYTGDTHTGIGFYKADKTYQYFTAPSATMAVSRNGAKSQVSFDDNTYTYTIALLEDGTQETDSETAYIRISAGLKDGFDAEDVIITINEEIVENVEYSIKNTLTKCINKNSKIKVGKDSSYKAIITPYSGYKISSILVQMGGVDITSSVVSGMAIHIPRVTGNIIVSAIAIEGVSEYTNLANLNDESWWTDSRLGYDHTQNIAVGCAVTNHIGLAQAGDVIRVQGLDMTGIDKEVVCSVYKSDKTIYGSFGMGTLTAFNNLDKKPFSDLILNSAGVEFTVANADAAGIYWRFGGKLVANPEDVIITINEEII